ncbi:permease [Hahella sp. CCB-MM4]|uniref:AEC family transporter n=1 Tax=Hahella sp. (strain CCB-MM4) TaxID=1926491 RepID=UPI000B9AC739|nr:AEC family transporter [Hahella sp. CCB-MM4]OZG75275.1 permease [Hahella sp. CCB-MM4]
MLELLLDSAWFSADIVLPIFFLVALGYMMRRMKLIDDHFIEKGSNIVFKIALPILIFLNVSSLQLGEVVQGKQLVYAILCTIAGFIAIWWIAKIQGIPPNQLGVFVQGSFRGNLGIIGLALCARAYDSAGVAVGSVLLGFITLLYNLLSVWALTVAQHQSAKLPWRKLFRDIVKNPLIIAIVAALVFAGLHLQLPGIVKTTGHYFGDLTLPLALLCVGGSVNVKKLRQSSSLAMQASLYKLVWLPVAQIIIAFLIGIEGLYLGTLFLMLASPTATVSFVMTKAMGGDSELAAAIVALSTLLSFFTISIAVTSLKLLGWV